MGRRLVALFATALVAVGCGEAITGTDAASGSSHVACGRDDRGRAANPRPGAPATPLVPRDALLLSICSYNGEDATPSTPQFGLLGTYRTDSARTISRLTAELDAIKTTPQNAGERSCVLDQGRDLILRFGYDSGDVIVTIDDGGCFAINSGPIHRLGLGAPVIEQIAALPRPVQLKWATVSGHVRLCGGPITTSGKTRCWTSGDGDVGDVEAIDSSNRWAAESMLRKGRFHFRIASPGRYRFRLVGTQAASFTVLSRTSATVRVGHTTHIVLTVPVP